MNKNYPLAVIINSYNRVDLLRGALCSLIKIIHDSYLGMSVIVFDAGSSDGSVEFVREKSLEVDVPVHLIQPDEESSGSFAAGVNSAVAYAAEVYPELEWCLLYETDNYLKNSQAIAKGIQLLECQQELAAVGFTVERHDGGKAGYGERFPTTLSFVLGQQVSSSLGLLEPEPNWQESKGLRFTYCDVVYTSPLLVRYRDWRAIGGMDQDTFPFTDSDVDLCWRFKKSGTQCAVLDLPGVVHDNKQLHSEWSEARVEKFHRSRLKLLEKHGEIGIEEIKLALALRHLVEIVGLAFLYLIGNRPLESIASRIGLLRSLLSGYND